MSTKYFILTKNENKNINDNQDNQLFFPNKSQTHILPYVNANYYISHGLFESDIIEWCKQFCDVGKNMLDIGAHTGTYSVSLAKCCHHVYSFEPQKMTYYALCGSIALSNIENITCYGYGLGSENQKGNQMLKIISEDGGGSSLHVNHNITKIIKEEKIIVETLDQFCLENIGFIKMDVEGNEYNVILGGIKTLQRSNYPKILFESNNENKELTELLTSLGYKITNINGYSNMYLAYI
jgi:FkbM family methyltransferase